MDKYLIVGLGNPGGKYQLTRHNMGFWTVDAIAQELNLSWTTKGDASIARSDRLFLQKPLTFMNNSGTAVVSLLRQEGISPRNLLVVYDDLDLPPGRIRLRGRGSSGGHRGIASIIAHLGTEDFPRLKIGIGRSPHLTPKEWVLAPIGEDGLILRTGIEKAKEAALHWWEYGIDDAMNQYNRKED